MLLFSSSLGFFLSLGFINDLKKTSGEIFVFDFSMGFVSTTEDAAPVTGAAAHKPLTLADLFVSLVSHVGKSE